MTIHSVNKKITIHLFTLKPWGCLACPNLTVNLKPWMSWQKRNGTRDNVIKVYGWVTFFSSNNRNKSNLKRKKKILLGELTIPICGMNHLLSGKYEEFDENVSTLLATKRCIQFNRSLIQKKKFLCKFLFSLIYVICVSDWRWWPWS